MAFARGDLRPSRRRTSSHVADPARQHSRVLRHKASSTIFHHAGVGQSGASDGGYDLTHVTTAASAALPAGAFLPKPASGDGALLSAILASLEDDKAEEIVTIPLAGKSEMADHLVIASGRSSRQVSSIADKLADRLKAGSGLIVRMEGKDLGDWVLIDAGDVIVHVFRPEVREFYQLEKMWSPQAPRAAETV